MAPSTQSIAAVRFGYGFRPGETPPADAGAVLASLAPGAAFAPLHGGEPLRARLAVYQALRDGRQSAKKRNMEVPADLKQRFRSIFLKDVVERFATPVASPHGFFERLAWFWTDHFAVDAKTQLGKTICGRLEVEAIRPHLAGRFGDLLFAAATHPAMLHFLDQDRSVGPKSPMGLRKRAGLNENLAREIIELHSLGVGAPYDQEDVRQFAELLTGLSFDRETGAATFRTMQAEPGAEVVLGKTYGGPRARVSDIRDAIEDLAVHPATARHIALKLATHFTSDAPPDALVGHMEAAFARTKGDLSAVYAAMLEHPASWETFGRKVKQPFDFIVSTLRAAGVTDREMAAVVDLDKRRLRLMKTVREMNQMPFRPPGPQGWPEEAEAWITPQGLTARIEWASRLGREMEARLDPRDLLTAALGDLASDETSFAARKAEARWEGLAFVFASPEFNRR